MSRRWAFALVGSMAAAMLLAIACGNAAPSSSFVGGTDASVGPPDVRVPGFDVQLQTDSPPQGALTIQPQAQTIDVPPTATLQFHAYVGPAPAIATWSIDNAALGAIDGNGLFTPSGAAGGTLNVYAQAGAQAAQTTLTIRVHVTDIPPGLDGGVLGALQAGGAADSNFQWLYPYDETVFPRGLLPPRLQWSGTAPQWVYVTASAQNLDYKGVFAPTNNDAIPGNPPQLDLPGSAWKAITLSAGAKDPVQVQITKMDPSGAVTGPISESWTIAQGPLTGVVYYNTYDSPLAQGSSDSGLDMGAVMRLRPGDPQPSVLIGGSGKGSCTVCHTLSANGSTMSLSAGHNYDAVYAITADASSPTGPLSTKPDNVYSFSALTPDGKYLLSCGSTALQGASDGGPLSLPDYGPNVVSMTQNVDSVLYQTADGGAVGSIPNVSKALMPAFSPDGTKLVFNRYEPGQDQRLAIAPFSEATLTFGAYTDVFVDPGYYLSWPTFLPDSQSFVFMLSSDTDQYSSFQQETYNDANGELLFYQAKGNTVAHLREAMGSRAVTREAGTQLETYLRNPDGTVADQDTLKNYEPNSLVVAAGGYYWVVFTSRRSYGNTIDNSKPQATPDSVKPKKLWVTAVDIDGPANIDWSHPAFYLPGQELGGGNTRAFWTLPPCAQNGTSCQAGSDCCNGFCREVPGDAGVSFACIAPPTGCSNIGEKCSATADCCGAPSGVSCIAGFCATPTPR